MLNIFNAFKKKPLQKNHFFITSHGQTATLWLAAALNQHPEIFCAHGYSYPTVGAETRDLTPEELIARQAAVNARFWTMSLSTYMSELDAATQKPMRGNIHGFYLGRFLNLCNKIPRKDTRDFTLMNMARHPLTRLQSTYKCWILDIATTGSIGSFIHKDFDTRCKHIIKHVGRKHKIDMNNLYVRCFTVASLALESITNDIAVAKRRGIENIIFEDITSNQDYFKDVVKKATAATVSLDDSLISAMHSTSIINKHHGKKQSPGEIFDHFEDWQKDVFKFIFERNSMRKVYADHGYDFSFI